MNTQGAPGGSASPTLDFKLTPWQLEVFSDKTRFQVVVAGRRCGKTRLAATNMLVNGLNNPNKHAWTMYVAPTYGQAMDLVWDLLMDLGRPVIRKWNINDGEISLVTGTTLYVRGADNPDRLRGPGSYYVVLDEFKDMKASVWEKVLRPSLSDYKGRALFIGSPEPGDSLFRDYYELGASGKDPDWKAWHFTTYDNPFIDPLEIEAAKRSMSTFAFKQEYLASFDTAGTDVFKEEWLLYSEGPDGGEPKQGDYYIAVDLAGFEEVKDPNKKKHLDDTAISVVKVTDEGKWWVKKIECGRWDVRETAVRILMNIRNTRPVAVGMEKGSLMRAVMPYLTDLMRKNNLYAHVEAIPTSGSSKVNRVVYALQGMFEHGRIVLNSRENWDKFKDQLLMFPSVKAHDDLPDSLSMIQHLVRTPYGAESEGGHEWAPIDGISGVG